MVKNISMMLQLEQYIQSKNQTMYVGSSVENFT